MIILLSSYSLNESSKFRMVFRSASLLQHPFPDVWRTVQNRDPCRLTRVQKTNTFDIHQIEFPQVQRDACSTTVDLRLQLIKVLRSKLPAQTNPSAALVSNLSDLQRHGLCSEEQPNKCTPSFKIATICDSVNLDFLMTSPVPGESTIYLYPSRGSLRFRCGNTTTERPIFQTCGHGETDEDIVTRNSRRGSKFVRKTRQEGFLFSPTPPTSLTVNDYEISRARPF